MPLPTDEARLGVVLSRFTPLGTALTSDVMRRAVVSGLEAGTNPLVVARSLTRRLSGLTFTRAATIARTEMMTARWAETQRRFQNDPAIISWQRMATKDGATCPTCAILHGKIYPTKVRLRSHPNCRCTMVPVTKRGGAPIPPSQYGTARIGRMNDAELRRLFGPRRADFIRRGGDPMDLLGTRRHPIYGDSPVLRPTRLNPTASGERTYGVGSESVTSGDDYATWRARIADNDYETNVMFTSDGRVLTAEGDSLSAPFSDDMVASQRGSTVLHNHPADISFSPQDIASAGLGDWSAVEAVHGTRTYRAVAGPKGWPDEGTVLKAFRAEASEASDKYASIYFDSTLTPSEQKALAEAVTRNQQHNAVQRLADDGWLKYTVEPPL